MQISKKEFDNIKKGRQVYIITDDDTYNNKDFVFLNYKDENIEVEITSKSKYKSLSDCFNLLPCDLFGFENVAEAVSFYKNISKIIVYRIKYDGMISFDDFDSEVLDLLDITTIKKNNVGHSSSTVYEPKDKSGREVVIKIQSLSSRNSLKDEYERAKWLQGKILVPQVYFFKETAGKQYYIQEKISGISAHKFSNFAKIVGENLKKIHSIAITDCPFKNNSTDNLLKQVLEKIDIILPEIMELYPQMSREDIIKFLIDNKPKDEVLVHGDYSLPNILINEESKQACLIDLGDLSISTKYFDLYYLKKSFIRNKKIEYFDQFLEAYGIKQLDETAMKWMSIVDKVLF